MLKKKSEIVVWFSDSWIIFPVSVVGALPLVQGHAVIDPGTTAGGGGSHPRGSMETRRTGTIKL